MRHHVTIDIEHFMRLESLDLGHMSPQAVSAWGCLHRLF
jgi:hypothetical protein